MLGEVVVEGRHLAEAAAHQFLHGGGGLGVDLLRFREFHGQAVDAEKHGGLRRGARRACESVSEP
jgi:hypothetical protein